MKTTADRKAATYAALTKARAALREAEMQLSIARSNVDDLDGPRESFGQFESGVLWRLSCDVTSLNRTVHQERKRIWKAL